MNSLEKLLLDSSCAAALVGPKIGHPRRWNSSTTPNVRGSSGPTTVTSGFNRLANSTIELRLFRSTATHSASPPIPPLPGAQYSFLMRGDCRSFHTIACSRPPLPRTSTFMGPGFARRFVCRKRDAKRKKRVGRSAPDVKLAMEDGERLDYSSVYSCHHERAYRRMHKQHSVVLSCHHERPSGREGSAVSSERSFHNS